jgi:putative ABC transport system permease protein
MEKSKYQMQISMSLAGKTNDEVIAMVDDLLADADEAKVNFIYETFIPTGLSELTYEEVLDLLGVVDLDDPSAISIYAKDFHGKEDIADLIKLYNSGATEENQISYTDYVALVMSGVSTIIDAISYILIGFVSVSLVVSSIMIGIITYISVLERTKEIGILRAVGASKRDVSRVFTAETIIEGFAAGAIGIAVTIVLCLILNAILYSLSGLPGLKAILPPKAGVVLVLISILLTLVAGFFPSRLAAKKDPVEALRTE